MTMLSNKSSPSSRRFGDSRALMAALARLIAGGILSIMFYQYFGRPEAVAPFSHSRLWWEIVLNLQLLSAGMVWFSYSDRVSPLYGRERILQILRVCLAICAVLTPAALGLLGAIFGWFLVPPSPWVFNLVAGLASLHLLGSLILYFRIETGDAASAWQRSFGYHLTFFSPVLIFVISAIVSSVSGGKEWIILLPLLVYAQGAMPYLMEFVGITTSKSY